MNPRCSSMHDALRTASARGAGPSSRQELQRSYTEQCQDEEWSARERWNQSRNEQRVQAEQSKQQQRAQNERNRMQCEGLRDVIRSRSRQASAPNDLGLQRARQAYAERCTDGAG